MGGKTLIIFIHSLVLLIFEFYMQRVASQLIVPTRLTQVVQTDKGPIRGIFLSTVSRNITYSAFKGIPYAKPPVGSLRFKPPEEIDSWEFLRNSTKEGEKCIQREWQSGRVNGSEDCLFLNVYTPKINFQETDAELKAVIVWIHGGAFTMGSGNQEVYGPDFLIEEDIVVVTFNYRLGALGFLALNHSSVLGNAGLKDQNLVLRWVKRNIRNFGGDPNNTTLAGQSAGAVCVDYHILSDLSKGLFQRSICMSGSPINPWGFITPSNAKRQAYNLGLLLNNGQNVTNSDKLVDILRNASAADIVSRTAQLTRLPPFGPTLENPNIAEDQEKFLIQCYAEKYRTGNYSKQPHLMGFVSDEALGIVPSANVLFRNIRRMILSYIEGLEPLSSFISRTINDQLDQHNKNLFRIIVNVLTDIFFITGIDLKQQLMSNTSSQPIYYYRNSFDAKNESFHQIVANNTILNGTAHGDDLYYIFYADFMNFAMNPNSPLSITRSRMVRMWTNFAKYGNPTPDGTNDELLNITWPDSRSTGTHLEISDKLTVNRTRPISENVSILERYLINILPNRSGCNSY